MQRSVGAAPIGVILSNILGPEGVEYVPQTFLNRDHDVRAGSWSETALLIHSIIDEFFVASFQFLLQYSQACIRMPGIFLF